MEDGRQHMKCEGREKRRTTSQDSFGGGIMGQEGVGEGNYKKMTKSTLLVVKKKKRQIETKGPWQTIIKNRTGC